MRSQRAAMLGALMLLALAGCGGTASSQRGNAGIGLSSGGVVIPGSSGGPTGAPAPGSAVTSSPMPAPTATHSVTIGPLSPHPDPPVSNPPGLVITATVSAVSIGPLICPGTVHVTGTISVNKGPANVNYIWSLSDSGLSLGPPPPLQTVYFGGTGAQTKTVSTDWSTGIPAGWGLQGDVYLVVPSTVVLHPPLASAGATWLYYCGGTASTPTVTAVAGCANGTPSATFKTTISVPGGPQTVNFTWHFSDGTTSQGQISLGSGTTGSASQDVTISHPIPPPPPGGIRPQSPSVTTWITVDSPAAMTTGKKSAVCPPLAKQ